MQSRNQFKHGGVELINADECFIVKVNGKEVYRSQTESEPSYIDAYNRYRKEAYGEKNTEMDK